MTMNMPKTPMLAALAVLSFGACAAMAQSQVPSSAEGSYFSEQHQAAPLTINNGSGRVQSGSSNGDTLSPLSRQSPYKRHDAPSI
jgi:hypothetical protein